MTKPAFCLFLALGLAACAPKAVVVEEPVPPTNTRSKPANKSETTPTTEEPATLVNRNSGMIVPDLARKLPDGREMAPTTPAPAGGGGVIATPPTADKRGE